MAFGPGRRKAGRPERDLERHNEEDLQGLGSSSEGYREEAIRGYGYGFGGEGRDRRQPGAFGEGDLI